MIPLQRLPQGFKDACKAVRRLLLLGIKSLVPSGDSSPYSHWSGENPGKESPGVQNSLEGWHTSMASSHLRGEINPV
jgi:hypothetical protein